MKKTTRQELDVSVINDLNRIKEINDKIGQVNGIATLDENGKVPSSQLDIDTSNLATKEEVTTQLAQQATEINRLRKENNKQNKEIAYLKLKQQASDRIEGGTTFADGMNGNLFGIEFDEKLSENVVIKDGALTMNEGAMVEANVSDSVVVSGSGYSTSGNGGRKLVRLDNGTLVCAVRNSDSCILYKSVNNGESWTSIFSISYGKIQDVTLQTDGVYIYWLDCNNNHTVTYRVFDENGQVIDTKYLQHSQTALGTCSLAINPEGTELHACWSSKNSTYPNSDNIQYCKGVISEGGTVTWRGVEQITSANDSMENYSGLSIVLNENNHPLIVYSHKFSNKYDIQLRYYTGNAWSSTVNIYNSTIYQFNPSAIFVPKSVNGLANGRIWVAWHGDDSEDNDYDIRLSYSDNGGATWSGMKKLVSESGYGQAYPSITANKNNEIFITWYGRINSSPSHSVIRQIKWKDGSWGNIENIKQVSSKVLTHPSTLHDIKFSTDFTKPLVVYTIDNTSINFTGSWQVGDYTPTTEGTAVYKLPSTDYVGMFVQKEGSVNITATINDIPMDLLLENNEYQFTKALESEAEVTLKLSLSRENTVNGNKDKITRMLGGRS